MPASSRFPRAQDDDQLAFLREGSEYRNVALVEQPNGDFGHTIVRQVLFDAYQLELYERLQHSTDPRLAAIAAKAVKETRYHFRYSGSWLVRLGDGTEQSHARVAQALERLWPFTRELFDEQEADRAPGCRLGSHRGWPTCRTPGRPRVTELLREAAT